MTLKELLNSYTVSELQKRRVHLPKGSGLNRKADLVAAISRHLLSDTLATTVAQLSDLERAAVAETVHNWQGWFDAVGFKAKYGRLPKHFTRSRYTLTTATKPSPTHPARSSCCFTTCRSRRTLPNVWRD